MTIEQVRLIETMSIAVAKGRVRPLVIAVLCGLSSACQFAGAPQPVTQAPSRESLERAIVSMEIATELGVNLQSFGDHLRALAVEIELAKLPESAPARPHLARAVSAYRDSFTVWNWKIEHGKYLRDLPLTSIAMRYQVQQIKGSPNFVPAYYDADDVISAAWKQGSTALVAARAALQ